MAERLGIESEPVEALPGHPALWRMTSRLDHWTHPVNDHIVDVRDQIEGHQAEFLAIREWGSARYSSERAKRGATPASGCPSLLR